MKTIFLLFFGLVLPFLGVGQDGGVRKKKIKVIDSVRLDSLSIYPHSFQVYINDTILDSESYTLNFSTAVFTVHKKIPDTLYFIYQVLPFDFSKRYQIRDSSILFNKKKDNYALFKIENYYSVDDIFGGNELNKNGSISRGVSFGNNQDLGINSSLNLEISGKISSDLKILASVSDANIPIQPEGNTNKLQEFDKVFIQIYNDRLKLVAGDFWLSKPTGYFMNYRKRAQGLSVNYKWNNKENQEWKTQLSGALSKGKFNRQIIQGIEANQGPYRLIGAENEPFIIVLSGTEKVFIDGRILERGQEYDYTIDYNSSELIFTSRNLITKDTRIVVEFQYSDQNYARSLVQNSISYHSSKIEFWLNSYSEQDAKNQPLQQDLSSEQRSYLSQIGDELNLASVNSIDSVGFFDNQNLYKLVDSLGFDSIMVFSVHPDSAFYRVYFEFVGEGNGDYVLDNYNALGKVYKWVKPESGLSQGSYRASRSIITPKKQQMFSSGIKWKYAKNSYLESEWAMSNLDLNTYSKLASQDNIGYSNRTRWMNTSYFGKVDTVSMWSMKTKAEFEFLSTSFAPVQQYRAVEFDRDWNTRFRGYEGNQILGSLGTKLGHKERGTIAIDAQHFSIGSDYNGQRISSNGKWKQKGWNTLWDGSYLSSKALSSNSFLRHRLDVSKKLGPLKIGYKDDHERNRYADTVLSGLSQSYEFFDYQFYVANHDTSKVEYKVYYRQRFDRRLDSGVFKRTALAKTTGAELHLNRFKNQKLTLISGYRSLEVLDTILMNQRPENSVIGRLEYHLKAWKNAVQWSTFYEIGSGLEQKREFLYIQVNDGQGVYTWIDYNADGVKDLNEFEISQFIDQANYIRVFIPSNSYVTTYFNEFNQSIYLRPERIWSRKKGVLKFISRFSDQARFRINKKSNAFLNGAVFNPLDNRIADTNLISTAAFLKNTLFFNRTGSVFGARYIFQENQSKTLLASGFDSRLASYHEANVRWNMTPKLSVLLTAQDGTKKSLADYTSGRDYSIEYSWLKSSFSFQPSTNFRVTLDSRIVDKDNVILGGGETCVIKDIGSTFKYNQTDKGSFQGAIKLLKIDFTGNQNSAVGFEMLEALRPGINYTWSLGYQKTVSKNLQITFQYLGRKSENTRMIHSGGMELRAFF
tara:strand:- start:13533 stop:16970 length:3438 start_codon:yes stop_codon:yes gene_type:complete